MIVTTVPTAVFVMSMLPLAGGCSAGQLPVEGGGR